MITEHYVEKSGYWIYSKLTKTVTISLSHPYSVSNKIDDWIYVDGPGTIRVKFDKILDFIPQKQPFNNSTCWTHTPKEYVGFTDKFLYCEICGIKL